MTSKPRPPASDPRSRALEHVFLEARGKLIAALLRRFGADNFELVEDAIQEAGVRAMVRGNDAPGQLEGWLLRVAHNIVIDALRRDNRLSPLADDRADTNEPEFRIDDQLSLIFFCCHPLLSRAAQIALTLRVVFGLTVTQIARAYLSDERAMAQRLVRAKRTLREAHVLIELPEHRDVPARRQSILDVLYQLFTEGYSTTDSEAGIDDTLCHESLRLVRLLTDDDRWTSASAEALRALFCFHTGRLAARLAEDGSLLLLQEQDRAQWDGRLLAEGFEFLKRSTRGETLSRFHLEAGIAACHAAATSYAATDWGEILGLYEMLRELSPSPVVEVNRAFAVAMCRGALAGIDELDAIPEREMIENYPYALAIYAELQASLGNIEAAQEYLGRALRTQTSPAEQALLRRKLVALVQAQDRPR